MKKIIAIMLAITVLIVTPSFAFAKGYVLGPGDVLAVSVWGFEELQAKDMIIRPDGKIAFPLAGELQAAGLTSLELTQKLTSSLAEYVINPLITVNIQKYRTTRVYVLGEVAKPGMYEIDKDHTVLDAIGIAGSYTRDAAKKKVHIISKDNPNQPQKVNLLDILKKGDLRQNISLKEGDIVYLTKNNRIDFAKEIMPLITGSYYINRIQND
jgi:polysaccharide export outer membrane protein